jgi:hypothetical protein
VIQFLIDEDVTPALRDVAIARGYNAYHVQYLDWKGRKDFAIRTALRMIKVDVAFPRQRVAVVIVQDGAELPLDLSRLVSRAQQIGNITRQPAVHLVRKGAEVRVQPLDHGAGLFACVHRRRISVSVAGQFLLQLLRAGTPGAE